MSRKVVALLQARTDSTRLPGKVLKSILGKPMIIHQLERTSRSKRIDKLLLVTSNEASDDELSQTVLDFGYTIFRGDKNNVLKRFYESVQGYQLADNDIVVRLTGDCPLHDAEVIDEAIDAFQNLSYDYIANTVEPVYPDGFDVEVFTYKALKLAYKNAVKKSDLEHVTPYIRNSSLCKVGNLERTPVHNDWRLTVDEPEDFNLISIIFEHFNSNTFSFDDIVFYLEENPELLQLNNNILRNEGYLKSLKEDNDDN